MKHVGMKPHHTLLDLGCGTLRGGINLIPYLAQGHYTGLEPNSLYLRIADRLVQVEGLRGYHPSLVDYGGLREGQEFDFILTQSVLNHLNEDRIQPIVRMMSSLLKPNGIWISSVWFDSNVDTIQGNSLHPFRPDENLNTRYNPNWFESILSEEDLTLKPITGITHPHSGFSLITICRKGERKE
jgi:SAM-dependent methyltransferase